MLSLQGTSFCGATVKAYKVQNVFVDVYIVCVCVVCVCLWTVLANFWLSSVSFVLVLVEIIGILCTQHTHSFPHLSYTYLPCVCRCIVYAMRIMTLVINKFSENIFYVVSVYLLFCYFGWLYSFLCASHYYVLYFSSILSLSSSLSL